MPEYENNFTPPVGTERKVNEDAIKGGFGNPAITSSDIDLSGDTLENLMAEVGCNPELAECHAKCCANTLLLSDKEIARIKNYIGRNHIIPKNRHNIFSQEYKDICPFLNDNERCSIWSVRPEVCQHFYCNMFMKKKPNMPDYRKKHVINMLLTFSPDAYCPNPPDLEKLNEKFKQQKRKAYKGK